MAFNGNESIDVLDLSTRTNNALKMANINTIKEFINTPSKDFINIKNLGAKSLEEIYLLINKLGSNNTSEVKEDKKTFIGIDGIQYLDIKLDDLELSVRANNCLKRANITYFSEIYSMLEEDLYSIKNMGKNTVLEIQVLKNNLELKEVNFKGCVENDNLTYEVICQSVFNRLREKLNVDPNRLFSEIIILCQESFDEDVTKECIEQALNDTTFINKIFHSEYVYNLLVEFVLELIGNEIYGIFEYDINNNMPSYFKNINFVNEILLELLYMEKVEQFEDRYIIKRTSFSEGCRDILSEKEYKIIIERVNGKTLEEVGKSFNLTRERVRQIEANIFRKLNKCQLLFQEDIYKEIFKNYDISKDDFGLISNNMSVYYYLDIRYKQDKNDKKILNMALEDKNIPITFRRLIEKIVYKDYVRIGGKYIPCTRADISSYILQTFAKDSIRFEEFASLYTNTLEELGLSEDAKLSVMERGYENKLARSKLVLNSRGKKIRYYNYELYDFSKLLETLDLLQYENVEYSTLKFLKANLELMQEFDIRDEYELHNLLKMLCTTDEYSGISFKRMPNIEFGIANREYQVFELLLSLAPVSKEDLANAYEDEYGVYANTVMANFLSEFDEYFHDGIYKIDTPELQNEIAIELKTILNKDFYLLSELKNIFIKTFPNYNANEISPLSIKKLGFKVYSNYVISDKYASATEYFYSLLTEKDIVDINSIDNKIKEIIAFLSQLYKLKEDYTIIEFMQGKYINFRKLSAEQITKSDIEDYVDSVIEYVGSGKYFTMHSLIKSGFSHTLHDLGFEDWFYTSLLIERKLEISYRKVGGTKILYTGIGNFKLKDLIENFLFNTDELYVDIYELNEILWNTYGIKVSKQTILNSIYESEMFYDQVSEKIYADYQVYYEEI